ncbi:hypothetical protein [Streptomonospora wellingtoniae]|uniref:ABC transporter permease n=1 Tax=Streptomonospora wellingtoniae TaxID=3075544 RepID=A0ABU2KPY0_9ACTN|nr:hypothetical protein [Streptomonospora sp. DSM 45055]MDT0301345.1 hypothetical protein [Streptomonospora sp. DSM 45055]
MNRVAAAGAVVGYEARMAARSRAVWIGTLPVALLCLLIALAQVSGQESARLNAGATAEAVALLVPVGIAVVLADRLRRSRTAGLDELLDTMPGSGTGRVVGVLGGAFAVALLPVAALFAVLGAVIAVRTGDPAATAWSALAFVLVVLPACAWIAALASLLGLVLPVTPVRFLVVPLWFWAVAWNHTLLWVPTPVGTLLVPSGEYPSQAWFGTSPSWAGRGQLDWLSPAPAGAATGLLNLACVLLGTALMVGCARLIMMRKR